MRDSMLRLSRREYFAIQCLTGILSGNLYGHHDQVQIAVEIADRLMQNLDGNEIENETKELRFLSALTRIADGSVNGKNMIRIAKEALDDSRQG